MTALFILLAILLNEELKKFEERCKEKGKPLSNLCIVEAFPGDSSTSYILQVKLKGIEDEACTDILDFLFDTLWETTTKEVREQIFTIQVLTINEQLHCIGERPN